jgi:CPA2 family monovalent cation:H+ antiporter-2
VHTTAVTLIELGAVLLCLGVLGRLAGRFGLSPIPLYLVGGLFFGHGGFLELEGIARFSEVASEIGVVLLLLMLGLAYTATELVTGMRQSWMAGVVDAVLNFLPGAAVALILGWGPVGALVMGGVTYISSSGIAAKVISDLGRLGNRETPTVLAILVFEDLAMAVYLPVLTAVLAGLSFVAGVQTVGISLVAVTVVLVVALRWGNVVSAIVDSKDREVFLLTPDRSGAACGWARFGRAGLRCGRGIPPRHCHLRGHRRKCLRGVLEPLRDLFAAIFFVVFGLNTDPALIPPVLGWAVLLAVVTAATKIATGWWAAARQGVGPRGRGTSRNGAGGPGRVLNRHCRSGRRLGAVHSEIAPLATTYVLIMAILGPILARIAEPPWGCANAGARNSRFRPDLSLLSRKGLPGLGLTRWSFRPGKDALVNLSR